MIRLYRTSTSRSFVTKSFADGNPPLAPCEDNLSSLSVFLNHGTPLPGCSGRASLYLEPRFRRHVYEERLPDSTAANRLRKVNRCISYKYGNRGYEGDKLARDRRE